jgi:VanZ family protein
MGGRFLKYWVPLLLWMALIFVASTKAGGPGISSYFLHLVLRWLDPGINAEHFEVVHIGVRKTAHLTEYAGLGYLALRTARAEIPQAESRPAIAFGAALLFCAFYASTDEFHQSFVPTRHPAATDVMIDTAGAAIGLSLTLGIERLRRAE